MLKRYLDLHLFSWFCKYQFLSLTQLRAEYPRGVNVEKLGGQHRKLGGHRSRTSRQAAVSEHHQCLDTAQEEALISLINYLTNCGLPPTNYMVKNLAKEIIGCLVGKNQSSQFIWHHKDRLTSHYLRNIDKKCQDAEYAPIFKQFYDLVMYFWFYIHLFKLNS